MMKTGRKTVKGSKTSAPMVARATQTSQVASGTTNASPAAKGSPSREEIARRSFEIFLERGGQHGHDLEHWAQAERELGA